MVGNYATKRCFHYLKRTPKSWFHLVCCTGHHCSGSPLVEFVVLGFKLFKGKTTNKLVITKLLVGMELQTADFVESLNQLARLLSTSTGATKMVEKNLQKLEENLKNR